MDGEVQDLLLSSPAVSSADTACANGFNSGASSLEETVVVDVQSQVFHTSFASSG